MIIKNSLINFIAQIFSSVFSLAAVWIFTRYLSASEYGHFSLLLASSLFIYPFLFTWLRVGVLRKQSASPNLDLRKTIFMAVSLIVFVSFFIFFAYFQFYSLTLSDKIYIILITVFLGLAEIITENMRNKQATKIVAVAVFVRALLYPVIGIILVLAFNFASQALIIGFIFSLIGNCLVFYTYLFEKPYRKADKDLLISWLKGAGIITLGAMVFSLNLTLDRFTIAYFFTLKEVGEFATSSMLVKQIFAALTASIVAAYMPRAIELYNKKDELDELKSHLTQGLELLFAISLPLSLACFSLAPAFGQYFLGESFRAAAFVVMPMIGLGSFFTILNQNYLHTSFHFKNVYWPIALSSLIALIFNIISLYFLGRKGIEGVAQAFFISELLAYFLTYFLARRFYKLEQVNRKIIAFIALNCIIFYLIDLILKSHTDLSSLLFVILALGIAEMVIFFSLNLFQCRTLLPRK